MTDASPLAGLLERLEAATGPDRERFCYRCKICGREWRSTKLAPRCSSCGNREETRLECIDDPLIRAKLSEEKANV